MDTPAKKRIASVDILRGIVMIIMALDHTRDYFSNFKFDPTDFSHTTTALFFTRWITHYCAPVFVFLSGTSAFLSLGRGKTKKQASFQLLTRGIWLIILELTIIRFGWLFNLDYSLVVVQVIWAIGWSMVVLSLLIFLNRQIIAGLALLMIFGHNLLDGIHASEFGGIWWNLLHEQAFVPYGNHNTFAVLYPVIPWIGVMAAGYCFGAMLQQDEAKRNRQLYWTGGVAIVAFIIIRYLNVYGDLRPWTPGQGWISFLSFLNTTKYPPSLLYLLMTLGPAIFSLPLLEQLNGKIASVFSVYGRVPLFYYILHIYLLHTMAVLIGLFMDVPLSRFTGNDFSFGGATWGFSLPAVYGFWLLAVAILYAPCKWFMKVKANNRKWWLSYL